MKSLIIILILLIPIFSIGQSSISINSTNSKTKVTVANNGDKFSLEYKGDIILTKDDSDILSISDNGYIEIKKSAFGSRRKVIIESEDGNLNRQYFVGSKQVDFDPDGRKWLAEILQEVVRTTTIASEQRVSRLFEEGGAKSVLDEIREIDSDYVKSRYLSLLIDEDLSEKDLVLVLDAVGDIDSDHYKADVLSGNLYQHLGNKAIAETYIGVAGDINSDHHKANIIRGAIESRKLENSELATLIEITNDINSDHHKAEVLIGLIDSENLNKDNVALLISSAKDVNSDQHKANILTHALKSRNSDEASRDLLITSIADMNSDHHKANVLVELLDDDLNISDLNDISVIVDRDFNSDHHKATVLKKLIDENEISPATMEALAKTINRINSDHHKGEIMHSLSNKDLTEKQLIQVAEIIENMNSDLTKSDSLISFAPIVRKSSSKVKAAFVQSAQSMASDTSQERVIRLFN